jgi:hypothetical protein
MLTGTGAGSTVHSSLQRTATDFAKDSIETGDGIGT